MRPRAGTSPFAVNTYSYTQRGPVRECLERLSAHGYSEFELMIYPGHLWPSKGEKRARRDLKDFLTVNGLRVTTLNMPNIDLNVAAASPDMRDLTVGFLRQVIELAGDIGAPGVVIGPGKANPLLPMAQGQLLEYFYAALRELVPFAASFGTAVLVENMPFAFLPGIAELVDAVQQYGDPAIGVVYDVANGHFANEDVQEGLRTCAARLCAVHLSDTTRSLYRHDEVGLGTVNFSSLPSTLAEVGFARRPILEIIAADADDAVERSEKKLLEMGWSAVSRN